MRSRFPARLDRITRPKNYDDPGRDAENPDRLLDGENPSSRFIEDATHWTKVYTELLQFKERLLEAARQGLDQMPDSAAHREVAETDAKVLGAERDRLRKRLRFWVQRKRELTQESHPVGDSQGAARR